jgi:hypothetical protein
MGTNKEIYAIKKRTITETSRLYTVRWFGQVQRMEGNIITNINLESTGR